MKKIVVWPLWALLALVLLVDPGDDRLALVVDADRIHRAGSRDAALDMGEELFRVVLDPSGFRKNLLKLLLRHSNGSGVLIVDNCSRAGCALIKGQNVFWHG